VNGQHAIEWNKVQRPKNEAVVSIAAIHKHQEIMGNKDGRVATAVDTGATF
jgi:hypothetical protein